MHILLEVARTGKGGKAIKIAYLTKAEYTLA
jgi:hypothetical protein